VFLCDDGSYPALSSHKNTETLRPIRLTRIIRIIIAQQISFSSRQSFRRALSKNGDVLPNNL
ncbi:hypothetical protein, partial [Klebsiella pneumoniae]|uniref:hypothetical protein n=1 Tax=Klebsiella pneumoniae TaxID=573 RepID=UPI001C5292B3